MCSHGDPPATVFVKTSKESLAAYRTKSSSPRRVGTALLCSLSDNWGQDPVLGTTATTADEKPARSQEEDERNVRATSKEGKLS